MGTDKDRDGIHRELSYEINGAAMRVLNALRPGLDEKFHENALVIELRKRGHVVDQQREFPVYYEGQLIGRLIPDLIVDGKVIVDPKVSECFTETQCGPDAGLFKHQRPASGPSAQFQIRRLADQARGSGLNFNLC